MKLVTVLSNFFRKVFGKKKQEFTSDADIYMHKYIHMRKEVRRLL